MCFGALDLKPGGPRFNSHSSQNSSFKAAFNMLKIKDVVTALVYLSIATSFYVSSA